MLPPLNLWCHNLIDLTPFYQVMSSWFKLRILMLMKKQQHSPTGVFITMACEECLFGPQIIFMDFCSPPPRGIISCKRTNGFFWEWKNSATWRFVRALNHTQDLVVSPPKKQIPLCCNQFLPSGGPHHGGALQPKKGLVVWSKNRIKIGTFQLPDDASTGSNGRQLWGIQNSFVPLGHS